MTKGIKFLLIGVLLSLPFWYGINFFQQNLENFFYAQISQPLQEMNFVKIPEKPQKPNLELNVRAAISMKINKAGRDKILFGKNTQDILPIASLTKLMTALIVIEDQKNYDFKKEITVSAKAAIQEDVPEVKSLKPGEKTSVEKLLQLMLVHSSNDAAFALSEVIEVKNFVEKMNQKAKDLKLENTNFVNPTGLDPENLHFSKENSNYFNRSTTKDLSKLAQYILDKFPFIYEISIGKPYYQIKNGFSDLSLNMNIIGEKTGYTDEAGGCLILILGDEKKYIINIVLGAPSSAARIEEMQKLINWIEK